jgi:hypothetical protein
MTPRAQPVNRAGQMLCLRGWGRGVAEDAGRGERLAGDRYEEEDELAGREDGECCRRWYELDFF